MRPLIPILVVLLGAPAHATEDSLLWVLHRIKSETESKIQHNVLDPVMGRGRAYVFADLEFDLERTFKKSSRTGSGYASKRQSPAVPDDLFAAFGAPAGKEPKKPPEGKKKKEEAKPDPWIKEQSQRSQQVKSDEQHWVHMEWAPSRFEIHILHDRAASPAEIASIRDILLSVYGRTLKPDKIRLTPVELAKAPASPRRAGLFSRLFR